MNENAAGSRCNCKNGLECLNLFVVVVIDKGKLPLLASWGLQNADERNVSKDNRESGRCAAAGGTQGGRGMK